MIDGLGWELLREHPAAAPFLSELARSGRPLTAGFPATTVTSLSSLGTGLPPGQHGMLGYQVAVPGTGRLLNALRWDKRVDPLAWQPASTIFERAAAAGIAPLRIAQGSYRDSGLSSAVMRGAIYRPADTLGALAGGGGGRAGRGAAGAGHGLLRRAWTRPGTCAAARRMPGGSSSGTSTGWPSSWPGRCRRAPPCTSPPITAWWTWAPPTGSTPTPQPELRDGVALLGGEPRARHVYARPGAAADVLATWRETLGAAAWVVSRERGHRRRLVRARCAPTWPTGSATWSPPAPGRWAVVAARAEPRETALVGMHGSLTPDRPACPAAARTGAG